MIKLVHLLRHREGITRADFQHWWRTSHAPLMRKQQPVRQKARYVQLHALDPAAGLDWLAATDYEGVSESWYEDLEEKRRLDASPAGVEARVEGRADHGPYIDPEASSLQIETVEHVVFGPPGPDGALERPRIVVVDCLVAAPGVTHDEAAAWWRGEHAERVAALQGVAGFIGYTQSLVEPAWVERVLADGGEAPYVGFAESAWERLEALAAAPGSDQWQTVAPALCAGLERYRDAARSLRFLSEEYIAIDGPRVSEG